MLMNSVVLDKIGVVDFEWFCFMFYWKIGIYFEDLKCYFVDKCFYECMKVIGYMSFKGYFIYMWF